MSYSSLLFNIFYHFTFPDFRFVLKRSQEDKNEIYDKLTMLSSALSLTQCLAVALWSPWMQGDCFQKSAHKLTHWLHSAVCLPEFPSTSSCCRQEHFHMHTLGGISLCSCAGKFGFQLDIMQHAKLKGDNRAFPPHWSFYSKNTLALKFLKGEESFLYIW